LTTLFGCYTKNARALRLLDKGEASIAQEFDAASFIELQKRVRVLLSALLDPSEKLAMRQNHRFLLISDSESDLGSQNEEENQSEMSQVIAKLVEFEEDKSDLLKNLLKQVRADKVKKKNFREPGAGSAEKTRIIEPIEESHSMEMVDVKVR
jgi:hypothetical protein